MFRVANLTPFATSAAIQMDQDGVEIWVVLAKATYNIVTNNNIELSECQENVTLIPEYSGDAGQSSLRRDCEIVPHHVGTDVTLNATAYAPAVDGSEVVSVSVTAGDLTHTILAIGDRMWKRSAFGKLAPSTPIPFLKKEIRWEDAYGGRFQKSDEEVCFKPNPVGKGYYESAEDAVDSPLPGLELPKARILRWFDRPLPAGFGALAPAWAPRTDFSGTYDSSWERTRAPLLAKDHNPLFYRSCPSSLHSERPLLGGEKILLKNLTPDHHLEFELPRVSLVFRTAVRGDLYNQDGQLDRVIIEPDEKRLVAVWRSALKVGAALRYVDSTTVSLKPRIRRPAVYAR